MNISVWSQSVSLPEFKKLTNDKSTNVLIIGGGLCGILCAYFLEKAGIDYILVEANSIASGVTKNTTAKITSQHGLIYADLIKRFGKEKAQKYLLANQNALEDYKILCKNIECDYETKNSFIYSITDTKRIEEEVNAVNSLGFPAAFHTNTELPFDIRGAICFPSQAQFNPLKFISEISKNLNIYEKTFIHTVEGNTALSKNAKITANKIIVATHFPFINKYGGYFLKLYQHRSYVLAFENAKHFNGMYADENINGLSFRSYKNLLLLGGGSHRTGKSGGNWQELREFSGKFYPDSLIVSKWATQDCMSLDSIPYIGKYSKQTPDLYVASGFNKWGISTSMVAAKILCDMVQDKRNDFCDVFSPQRSILKPQLLINGFETAKNLLSPTIKRCPHLGCALKWNKYEHTWDCPCHGSRFKKDGTLIDNPSTKDANV